MNVTDLLSSGARSRPAHPALIFEGRMLSYADLDERVQRFGGMLPGRGVGPGDVVAIFLESCTELLVAYLGTIWAGAVPNVINASLRPEEVRHVVNDSGAGLLVTDPGRWDALEPVRHELCTPQVLLAGAQFADAVVSAPTGSLRSVSGGDLASLLYTSGTTGFPKGVMLTHRNITDNAQTFARVHYGQDDRVLVAAPLFHCWGLINGVLGVFAAGATAVVIRRFGTEAVLDLIEQTRPTVMLGVPTIYNFMARSPSIRGRNLTSLRFVLSAAAPMPHELIETLRRDWGVGYAESYGLTETSPVITTTPHTECRLGSCGRAMGDTVLKVADLDGLPLQVGEVGELWAAGTAISPGYYRRPEATAEVFTADGWFKTGDIVRMDEEGYVYIVDRLKDMINVGGEKVYPRDVEEVLHRHPAVADAAVVGVSDPVFGEAVKAVVVLKAGYAVGQEELIAFLAPSLARYKLPRTFEFIDTIPRSASGKALRRLLR